MNKKFKTSVGTIQVAQNSETGDLAITLIASPSHPGNVTVTVTNGKSNDSVKLLWHK